MKIQNLTIGQSVRHPRYGVGTVKSISEQTTDIRFDDATRTVDPVLGELSPAEPSASISGLEIPLKQFVEDSIEIVLGRLGFENPNAVVGALGTRWHKGKIVLHPADPTLQTKELPLEAFFHKVVGVRNQLRVLEQKINAHPTLNDGEKVEMQQYITRCYGSLTTFNVLFAKPQDDGF
jgi:hypothetical protein